MRIRAAGTSWSSFSSNPLTSFSIRIVTDDVGGTIGRSVKGREPTITPSMQMTRRSTDTAAPLYGRHVDRLNSIACSRHRAHQL